MRIERCGHAGSDRGHCAVPGCPNNLAACQECNQAHTWPTAPDRPVDLMWDELWGDWTDTGED